MEEAREVPQQAAQLAAADLACDPQRLRAAVTHRMAITRIPALATEPDPRRILSRDAPTQCR